MELRGGRRGTAAYKIGASGGALYLETHKDLKDAAQAPQVGLRGADALAQREHALEEIARTLVGRQLIERAQLALGAADDEHLGEAQQHGALELAIPAGVQTFQRTPQGRSPAKGAAVPEEAAW